MTFIQNQLSDREELEAVGETFGIEKFSHWKFATHC